MRSFGKYQIVEKIGEGGFGVIYRGFDPLIQRSVAVKTCTSDDPDVRDRFVREARIAGNLHHRNITVVYDFGMEGEVPYLVQEYLSGEDLDRKIKRREPISLRTRLYWLVQIARGLAYAHRHGVIHRDVKPSNIRILDDGTARIMDFGIATVQHLSRTLTQTGETIGTAAYLSPEQIRGESLDHRADIFSFGVLAYELATGERAFQGDNPSTVLYRVLTGEPRPLLELAPDCPPALAAIVERCLAKDRETRYGSCEELLVDLGRLIDLPEDESQEELTEAELHAARTRALPAPSLDQLELRATPRTTRTPATARAGRFGLTLVVVIVLALIGSAFWLTRAGLILADTPFARWTQALAAETAEAGPAPVPEPTDQAPATVAPSPVDEAASARDDTSPSTSSAVTAAAPQRPPAEATAEPSRGDATAAPGSEADASAPLRQLDTVADATVEPVPVTPDDVEGPGAAAPDAAVDDAAASAAAAAAPPEPASPSALASLTVRQYPGAKQAWVVVNGRPLGPTPIDQLELPAGEVELVLWERAGLEGRRLERRVELSPGMRAIVSFDLERPDRFVVRETREAGR